MKPKRSKKQHPTTVLEGDWVDIDDLVKPGETKEIAKGMWVVNTTLELLDPPEPIRKPRKSRPKKKSA